jgi:hypothetical protein
MRFSKGIALVAFSVAAVGARAEDLTIVSKVTSQGGADQAPTTSTSYLSTAKFRVTSAKSDVIMDLAAGKYTVIDNAKKQYWEMTQDDMNAMAQRMNDSMRQATQQNPQAAKMMESMMGGMMAQATVTKGTGTKTVAGYACTDYLLSMGIMKQHLWVATDLTPPVSMGQWASAQRAMFAGSPMASSMGRLMEEFSKIPGFPLEIDSTTAVLSKTIASTSEAVEVKKGPIAASAFAVPDGYTKVASPLAGGRPSH